MLQVQKPAQQLRKSIYDEKANPEHKKFILDLIGQKVGKQHFAYALMIFASVIYPLGFLYTNENNFSVFETSLARGIMCTLLNFYIARHYGFNIDFKDPIAFRILLLRNFIIVLQGIVYTIIQFYLTQPIIQTINSTGPLFIFLLDYKINGIIITKKQFYGVLLGISGVLITINGQFIIRLFDPDYSTTSDFGYTSNDPVYKLVGGVAFVIVQFLWAYAQIITKRLQGVNSIQINYHLGLEILLSSAFLYQTQVVTPVPTVKFVISLFAGSLIMVVGQIAFIGAITMSKNTGVISMLVFVSVIVGYVVSVVKYNQEINPFCTIGSVLIVLGLAKIVLKQKPKEEQNSKQQIKQLKTLQK